ncbi:MAG: N-6 DNA methylase, partial [Chlorobiales bacterium]|nr:N-6 DNA methylase [Chlorobiales bacterium]
MKNLETAFSRISELAESFKKHEANYLASSYSEAQVRKDFIDKFFHALGWDVHHEEQKNPYAQEVKIEDAVKTGKSKRRADYAFFIAPEFREPKFLCEAKKPSRNLRNPDDYFQAIRYGWNRQTPLVLLFDFEELHIIDSRYKPDISTALDTWHKSYHYTDYRDEKKFSEIYFLLARDEVASGAIENYAKNEMPEPRGKAVQKGLFKGGYQPVDTAFLEELDDYRLTLAKAFKTANPALDGEALTEAVQRTLDCLVFMRFLEDKQIEEPEVKNFGDKGTAWKNFISHSRTLDDKYNGIIFKPNLIDSVKDFVPPNDAHFKQITDQLSDSTSPYDFDSIPIGILGSIYERFLGKVVVTTAKRADVDEKPEVRKAGGVYYTPQYIVRYIVRETVGRLIDGKTPEEIAKMSFADIACGSGSFLIEVYTVLLEYHARYYAERPDKAKKGDTELKDGVTVLSLKKRRDILKHNIFGVDIDFQAVEVSQLSLYLKMLEDATPNQCVMFP